MTNNTFSNIKKDLLIAEILLGNGIFIRTAQDQSLTSSIVQKVKDYIGSKVDPNDRVGSIINMLAPGVIKVTFSAMGLGWLGTLLGLADSFFHFDVASILKEIWDKLKGALSDGKKITSEQINDIVHSSVQSYNTPATQNEADQAAQQQSIQNSEKNNINDHLAWNHNLRTAKLLRYAMEDYFVNKEAASKNWFSLFSSRKSATGNLLSSLLSLLFRVAISAAGLMVAGDIMNKFLDRPNSLDGTIQNGKEVERDESVSTTSSNNTPANTNWIENITNNSSNIQQMLLNFAKEIYPNLQETDTAIKSNPKFQNLVETISWYNHEAPGGPIVFIPRMFSSKKQLVDSFIDQSSLLDKG